MFADISNRLVISVMRSCEDCLSARSLCASSAAASRFSRVGCESKSANIRHPLFREGKRAVWKTPRQACPGGLMPSLPRQGSPYRQDPALCMQWRLRRGARHGIAFARSTWSGRWRTGTAVIHLLESVSPIGRMADGVYLLRLSIHEAAPAEDADAATRSAAMLAHRMLSSPRASTCPRATRQASGARSWRAVCASPIERACPHQVRLARSYRRA